MNRSPVRKSISPARLAAFAIAFIALVSAIGAAAAVGDHAHAADSTYINIYGRSAHEEAGMGRSWQVRERNIRGVMDNINTIVDFDKFPIVGVEIEGTVKATHLGKGTVSSQVEIDLSGLLAGGCSELVAGNIDYKFPDGSAINMVMTVNSLCADGVFTGQYDVTGGAGRFTGVDGLLDVTVFSSEDIVPNVVSRTISPIVGTLTY